MSDSFTSNNENQNDTLNTTLSGVAYYCQSATFDEQKEFNEYHYFEQYDPTKTYESGVFDHDYGYGKHAYKYSLYSIFILENGIHSTTKKFVVAIEYFTDDESRKLSEYCQCAICTAKWYNISKYFTCACCIGCLKSGMAQQYQINKARKYISDNGISI